MRSELAVWRDSAIRMAVLVASVMLMCAGQACAGGPRFVTGSGYSVGGGVPIVFYPSSPLYYTDPGALSSNVSHAQADAMVAAAAAAWNVPTSALVLKQGGELAEHVSSANVYVGGNEIVFPTDVSPTNYTNIQIPVIYDTDGSVIDTLLGEGASDPSGCRETGVVESVDMIGNGGRIRHAMLILNGRCVGSTPQQLTQMQYQLERAFGRVLGIAWSQLNDNIFTGSEPATAAEIANWPIMHPIDVLCGAYSYQCISNPFQLRMDDLAALAQLYPVTSANIQAGQVLSSSNAVGLTGFLQFPNGQGMELVNVTSTTKPAGRQTPNPWEVVSGLSGVTFQQNGGNPVTGTESTVENVGSTWYLNEGMFVLERVADASVENIYMSTEAIDPLYTGEYAIGPYQRPPVTPSGSVQSMTDWSAIAGTGWWSLQTDWDAAASCATGGDGTQSAPASSDVSGWWNGLLCPLGHSSWWSVQVGSGSTWTLEVTALDETGAPTTSKAQPVIGVWKVGDGGLPTVASQPTSMNSMAPGVTQLWMPASASPGNYMFAVADQYGAGRPDFGYQARVLYAASVSPAKVSASGGQIVITGEGFRPGNEVSVNGAPATVLSLSANQIVARAPSMVSAGEVLGTPVDVMVSDVETGGETDMANGLEYSDTLPDVMKIASAPSALETGVTSVALFAVRLFGPDGMTPLENAAVQISALPGAASFSACSGASTCIVQTDATGLVQTTVTGEAAGQVVLSANEVSGSAEVQTTVMDVNPVRVVAMTNAPTYVAAGASGTWMISLNATQDGTVVANVPVQWTTGSGLSLSGASSITGADGSASVTVSGSVVNAGTMTVTGCAWGTVCASWTLTSVDSSQWRIAVSGGATQSVTAGTTLAPVTMGVTDTVGHALQGASVTVYQTADAWEGTCASGRCAASPVLKSVEGTAVSDGSGSVVVTPLQVPGLPQVVNIAAVTGTQGFVSLSLPVTP